MKIKKKIKKKSGSKTEILRNLEAQPKRLVSYKKKKRKKVQIVFYYCTKITKKTFRTRGHQTLILGAVARPKK